jgi:multiple sugar transport system permease protein
MANSVQAIETAQSRREYRDIGHLVGNISLIALVVIWLFPVLLIILTSFKTRVDIVTDVPVFIFRPTLDNYKAIFGDIYHFEVVVKNSFIIAGVSTLLTIILSLPAAYSLARYQDAASKNIALWILGLRMMPPIAAVIPWYIIATTVRLIDSYPLMIVVYMVFGIPFAVWLLRGFIQEIPAELDQAAKLDGYGYIDILRKIILPLAMPSIAVTAIFTFLFSWNEFLLALILTDVNALTVPVAISKMQMAYSVLWGEMSAAGVVAALPMIVVVFALQRYVVRGLTFGAVK